MAGTVEITEEELLRNNKLRETVAALVNNPKAKLLLQEATKVVYPNAVTPDLDAERAQREALGGTHKEISDLKAEIAKEKSEREDRERLAELQAKHEKGFDRLRGQGYTDAGIEAIRKIMDDKGILDHDLAAAYFEKTNPPAPLLQPGHGRYDFFDHVTDEDKDLKKLIESKGENNALIDKMASDALAEVRGQPRR